MARDTLAGMNVRRYAFVFALAQLGAQSAQADVAGIPLRDYLSLTDVAWISASPDGSRIAYTSEETGSWQVWVANSNGSGRRQLTNDKEGIDFAMWVPHDPHTILSTKSTGGSGVDQFYYVRDDRPGRRAVISKGKSEHHALLRGCFRPTARSWRFPPIAASRACSTSTCLIAQRGSTRRVYTSDGTAYATAWSAQARANSSCAGSLRRMRTTSTTSICGAGAARVFSPHSRTGELRQLAVHARRT